MIIKSVKNLMLIRFYLFNSGYLGFSEEWVPTYIYTDTEFHKNIGIISFVCC